MAVLDFVQEYAEGWWKKFLAFLNGDVLLDLGVFYVAARLWALAAAGAAFLFWSSLVALFGALVG